LQHYSIKIKEIRMGWLCSSDGGEKEWIQNFGGETSCKMVI
jgi:hypothetical protein